MKPLALHNRVGNMNSTEYMPDEYNPEIQPEFGIQNNTRVDKNEMGYWNEKKVRLLRKYPFITDNDLHFSEGKEKEMIEMLGYKLGKTKEELATLIDAL